VQFVLLYVLPMPFSTSVSMTSASQSFLSANIFIVNANGWNCVEPFTGTTSSKEPCKSITGTGEYVSANGVRSAPEWQHTAVTTSECNTAMDIAAMQPLLCPAM